MQFLSTYMSTDFKKHFHTFHARLSTHNSYPSPHGSLGNSSVLNNLKGSFWRLLLKCYRQRIFYGFLTLCICLKHTKYTSQLLCKTISLSKWLVVTEETLGLKIKLHLYLSPCSSILNSIKVGEGCKRMKEKVSWHFFECVLQNHLFMET